MTEEPIRLVVILGSARTGRMGPEVARWFTEAAHRYDGIDVDFVDVADHPLPLTLDLAEPPVEVAAVREALRERLAAADAFVVITPEYNHSYPAALKNLLDWFLDEWAAKPAGFVSYGGMGGGLRAVEQLRQVFAELHAMTVRESVSFHNAWTRFGEHGAPHDEDGPAGAVKTMLDQLGWWARALRTARTAHPYQR